MLKKTLWIALIAFVVSAALPADAADNPWKLRGRIIAVQPNDSSDAIPVVGGEIAVDSATTVEVDATYMFNEKWGLEVVAAYTSHDLSADGGAVAGADLGTAKLLPPCFTAQYFFGKDKVKPYVGLGLNYTIFSYDLSNDLAATGATDVDLDNAIGYLANGGIDWYVGKGNWLINFDVKYLVLSTDATIKGGLLDGGQVGVDIDPWIIGLGVGYKF